MHDTGNAASRDNARKDDFRHVDQTIQDIKSQKVPENVVRNLKGTIDEYLFNVAIAKRRSQ